MASRRALPWIAPGILLLALATGCGLDSTGVLFDGSVGDGFVGPDASDGQVRDARPDQDAHDARADGPLHVEGGRESGLAEGGTDGGDAGTCATATDCPSKGACVAVSCDLPSGRCVYANVPDGTPTPMYMQVTGDCVTHECQSGVDTAVPTPTDLPAPVNDCGDPTCAGGTPGQSYTQHPAGSACGTYMGNQPGYCDGAGACQQCSTDGECVGTINDCTHPSCTAGMCTTTNAMAGTPTTAAPPQVTGDCQTIECDGNGGTMSVANNQDVPVTGTVCMTGVCTAGVPSKTNNPGVMCGGTVAAPQVCDAMGACGCQSNVDCTLPQTCGGGGTPLVCGCTPRTCGTSSPPATCGTVPDGCGGQLQCNDAKKDGTETDVDCGGGTKPMSSCTNLCAQGQQCGVSSDCANGLTCADGVCCNTACTGSCMACSTAKKGNGADGVCGPVAAGLTDPRGVCTSQPASSCGDEGGTCNGAGACAVWPSTTVCQPASCMGNTVVEPWTCATGACTAPSPASVDCTPYKCNGGACTGSCNVDTDCASTATTYCNSAHMCAARLAQGVACSATEEATQCLSTHCVDGFCCGTACTSRCQACSSALTGAANGTCANVVAGTADPSGTCTATTSSSCGTDGNCTAGGTCEDYGGATACGTSACSNGIQTTPGTCSGTGSCNLVTTPCTPYVCGATACLTACGVAGAGDANCATGYYCDGIGAGQCVAQQGAGAVCTSSDQCLSNTCIAGRCG